MAVDNPNPPALKRQLGLPAAALLVMSNMVGVGIFLMPGAVAAELQEPAWYFAAWLVGAVLALCGAASYGELGARFPAAGGEYVYLRAAFGPLIAFLAGWLAILVVFSGSAAMLAEGLASGLLRFVQALRTGLPSPVNETPAGTDLLAIVLLCGLTALNGFGLRPSGRFQSVIASTTFLGIATLVIFGLSSDAGALQDHLLSQPATGGQASWTTLWGGLFIAQVPIFFAYSGWNVTTYLGAEVLEPDRVIPRSLLIGTLLTTILYLALNFVFLNAYSLPEMAGQQAVGFTACDKLLGGWKADLPQLLILLAMAAALNAVIMAGPRVAYAMACDRVMPALLAKLHARFRTPLPALCLQGIAASVLLLSGTFADLTKMTSASMIAVSALTVLALLRLRRRNAGQPSRYRTPLYPLPPMLYLLLSCIVLVATIAQDWVRALSGLAVIGAGFPVYFLLHRKKDPS